MIFCTDKENGFKQQNNVLMIHNKITLRDLVLVVKAHEIYPEGKAVETAVRMKG